MTSFTTQAYNMLLQSSLFNITPLPAGPATGTRGEVGKPENIPEQCFIVDRVTAADGFPTLAERNAFNGFIDNANQYHVNFGFPITRVKSFSQILDSYKAATTQIGTIRIVTHGWEDFMQFPMFPKGDYRIGITSDQLDAFQNNDEEGLRWTLARSKMKSPMLIYDITSDIVRAMRKINSALLVPLKIDAPDSQLTGDVKLFLDLVTDHYHVKYGGLIPEPTTGKLLNPTQTSQLSAALDYIEMEIRKRLENIVKKDDLDKLKQEILDKTPGKLELIGGKEALPSKILGPVTTPGSLAHAMAATPRVENDLRTAISGSTRNLMFSNRTGQILNALTEFHRSTLSLGGGIVISNWSDIQTVPNLEDFFFICNDLYMMKNGEFEIAGGTDITAAERTTIRDGLIAISELIKTKIVSGGSGITSGKLNTLRNTIENLTWQESQSTSEKFITIDVNFLSELSIAVTGLAGGFRTNLNRVRSLMKSSSIVDIRGCKIGSNPTFLTNMRNFLGTDTNKPTVSAPDKWQSFPSGFQFHGGTSAQNVFRQIDAMVHDGFPNSHITDIDVELSFVLWKRLINFDSHFKFISELFADSDPDRFKFATLEWRTWQLGGTGVGIPILKMQAQRIDDIASLKIGDLLERFRLIFEIPIGSGLSVAQRATINALQPFVVSYKAVKASIKAATNPTTDQIGEFYNKLGDIGAGIDAIEGTTSPGDLVPSGEQNKTNLDKYVSNVEAYIFTNLNALLGPFFTNVRGRLAHDNKEIRYYCNIGLVLPVQSSSHPTITNPVVMISFEKEEDRARMFMDALRGWMKIQWKGSPNQAKKLNDHIDDIPVPPLANVGEFARRSRVSRDDPSGDPADNDSDYCPTDNFAQSIITTKP